MTYHISKTADRVLFFFMSMVFIFISFLCGSPKVSTVDTHFEIWYEKLPACPCENPDKNGVQLNDGWAKDKGEIGKYHKGADECFRSYPPITTREGESGQQCCYDSSKKLITHGSGAGTPDMESTCDGEDTNGIMTLRYRGVLAHYNKDVKPWDEHGGIDSGWVWYNQLWKPNNINGCTMNPVNLKKNN